MNPQGRVFETEELAIAATGGLDFKEQIRKNEQQRSASNQACATRKLARSEQS